MNNLIRKVFNRENIVNILIIVGGLLVVANKFFNFLPLSMDEKNFLDLSTILTMLILLGIDGFIEKISFFGKMQVQIDEINSKIEPDPNHLLLRRDELPSFITWLQSYNDFWLSGTSLINILSEYGKHIEQSAISGKHFRFLVIDPDDITLLTAFSKSSPWFEDIPELQQRGRRALNIIRALQKATPKGSIEVKVADYLFTDSYIILDGDKSNGMIHIEMYGYKLATGQKLHFCLKNQKNSIPYCQHIEEYNEMWNDAHPLKIDDNVNRGI